MPATDTSSTTRTLQQLTLPTRLKVPDGTAIRRGLYVDCETTGKDTGTGSGIMRAYEESLRGSRKEGVNRAPRSISGGGVTG